MKGFLPQPQKQPSVTTTTTPPRRTAARQPVMVLLLSVCVVVARLHHKTIFVSSFALIPQQQQQQQQQQYPFQPSRTTILIAGTTTARRRANHRTIFASASASTRCHALWMTSPLKPNNNDDNDDTNPILPITATTVEEDTVVVTEDEASSSAVRFDRTTLASSDDKDDHARRRTGRAVVVPPPRRRLRQRVQQLARRLVLSRPIVFQTASNLSPMPQAVASVLKDATLNALDLAVEEVVAHRTHKGGTNGSSDNVRNLVDVTSLIDEAFRPLEQSLDTIESDLQSCRLALSQAKQQSIVAMEAVEAAAIAQTEGAVQAVVEAEQAAGDKVLADIYEAAQAEMEFNDQRDAADAAATDTSTTTATKRSASSSLSAPLPLSPSPSSSSTIAVTSYEDVDFATSEMAPPFLGEDQCLVPGEPVVRVEKAPENSRRIFAGIDIPHSVDAVWEVLTDYARLQDVVPNLVVNDVLEEYNTNKKLLGISLPKKVPASVSPDPTKPVLEQCQDLASQMKGACLRQVGGARVAGIQFSARTTLEVREWPEGLPDFAHFNDEYWDGKTRKERAKEYAKTKLARYCFPRPFAISQLPTRDISMQSILNDDGEFRMYQGVWRMQPLPGCAPDGREAMRLTYAVEVSPRAYLPVALVEGRIVRDLCTNLVAIRDFLEKRDQRK